MFIYHSRFLTRGEVWFDDKPDDTPVDWIYYRHRARPTAGVRWKSFYTVLIDLAKSPDQLQAGMDPRMARKIEEAETKDHTRWERREAKDAKILDAVEQMWNATADARNVAPLDRLWLEELVKGDALEVSATTDRIGTMLTYHLGYAGKTRAQDLIVVSPNSPVPSMALRNRIHRANCLGHWRTMLALRERGLRYYDFGGWYPGATDIQLLGMNAFKEGFGGKVVREFEGEEIRTARGWCVLTTARMLKRAAMLGRSGNGTTRVTTHSRCKPPAPAANHKAASRVDDVRPALSRPEAAAALAAPGGDFQAMPTVISMDGLGRRAAGHEMENREEACPR